MLLLIALVSLVAGQTYCPTGPATTLDTNLGPVTLVGDAPTSIQDTYDCPKVTGARDLTYLSATLTPGNSYTLTYTVTSCGSFYTSLVGAWIDYNHNGLFESNESLFAFSSHSTSATASKTFVVPDTVKYIGATRMRVQLQETTVLSMDPCASFSYGGTKDFTINLRAANPYCTSGPTQQEDTHLGPLIFRGERRDIIQYANPCPGTLGPQNFTDQLADLRQGSTYPLALSVVTCNKEYPNILTAVWIDWNADGVWSDNEQVLAPTTKFGAIFAQITAPVDAVVGPTSMRAMVQETAVGQTTIGPCDAFRYGGTQDYPLQILASSSDTISEPGMQSREQEAGMNYREQIQGMQSREQQQQQTVGMQYREQEEVTPEQQVGMNYREKTGKKICSKKMGMRYREVKKVQDNNMQYREKELSGMQYREE